MKKLILFLGFCLPLLVVGQAPYKFLSKYVYQTWTGDTVKCTLTDTANYHLSGTTNGLFRFDNNFNVSGAHRVTFGSDTSGAGSKFMWIPKKYALRAGYSNSNYWDKDSVGSYSTSFGGWCKSVGNYSFSAGGQNYAIGEGSFTAGKFNYAGGIYSFAHGYYNYIGKSAANAHCFGDYDSTNAAYGHCIGSLLFANNYFQTVIGFLNDTTGNIYKSGSTRVGGNPIFTIGNGNGVGPVRSNAVQVLFNGNFGIGYNYPNRKLMVNGSVYMSDSLISASNLFASKSIFLTNADSGIWIGSYRVLNIRGTNNLRVGSNAGYPIGTGYENVILGPLAGQSGTTAHRNVLIGYKAGSYMTTDSAMVAIGDKAAENCAGSFRNTFVGASVAYTNTIGNNNSFYGFRAGFANDTADQSTIIGSFAGNANKNSGNTFVGAYSGTQNTSGYYNTAVGLTSLVGNSSGYWNTAIGDSAGRACTIGYKNTFLGAKTYLGTNSLYNTITIGYNVSSTVSNQITLGNNQNNDQRRYITVLDSLGTFVIPHDSACTITMYGDSLGKRLNYAKVTFDADGAARSTIYSDGYFVTTSTTDRVGIYNNAGAITLVNKKHKRTFYITVD